MNVRVNLILKRCKGCGICAAYCPKKVFGIEPDGLAEIVAQEECTGCKMCELRCPDFAIEVTKSG